MDSFEQRKQLPSERRPRMLKDFLLDDLNSSSSTGFKSFLRRQCHHQDPCISNLIKVDLNSNKDRLQRSRSKAAATTISAFQAVINAVKNIHFGKLKSPSILSRRNSNHDCESKENEVKITVITVKEIMRWKSFCDLVEEKPPPVDFASSTQHCATSMTPSITTPCTSNRASWCDSDFTSDYLLGEASGENNLLCVGEDSGEKTKAAAVESAVGSKGELDYEEEEQQSPVSVLDFHYEEDEERMSSFNQRLANMERAKQKLMQKIQHFECLAKMDPTNLEEWMSMEEEEDGNDDAEKEMGDAKDKAKQVLEHVKATSSLGTYTNDLDELVLDLFREELDRNKDHGRHDEIENEMIRVAKAWINGENREIVDWGAEDKREICIRDMDREGWNKFEEEEEEEVAFEVECGTLNLLVNELLGDLLL